MSEEQQKIQDLADAILSLGQLILMIDPVQAEKSYDKMQSDFARREAMTILAPNPFTELPKQELNRAKIKHLGLIVELRKNFEVIREAELKVQSAEQNSGKLAELFL